VAYLAWRRRWLTLVTAVLVIGAFTLVAVVRMRLADVPFLDSWLSNLAWLTGPLGNGDPGPGNPDRFSLINLAYPLRSFLAEQLASIATLAFAFGAALLLAWSSPARPLRDDLLALAVVAVLALLVTYHRYYDAAILALPVAWGFSVQGTARWRAGAVVLVLCALFVVPILGGLLQVRGSLPSWVADSTAWNTFILPHHAWALVGMVVVMLWSVIKERSTVVAQPEDAPLPADARAT
jgi:hypothetical protein